MSSFPVSSRFLTERVPVFRVSLRLVSGGRSFGDEGGDPETDGRWGGVVGWSVSGRGVRGGLGVPDRRRSSVSERATIEGVD